VQYWLVMPAAGTSLRFGGARPKQYMPLAGRTVLEQALQLFTEDARCAGIVLALSPAAVEDAALRARLAPKVRTVAGGAQRCDSVLQALEAVAAPDLDWVLVHDAARPILSAPDLERLLAAGARSVHGALLAAPVTDTIKQAAGSPDPVSAGTVDRSRLWRALTPQMFRLGALRGALRAARAAGRTPTDEAQAMEWQGAEPLLVAARDSNIKITSREDLAVAAAIYGARAEAAVPGAAVPGAAVPGAAVPPAPEDEG